MSSRNTWSSPSGEVAGYVVQAKSEERLITMRFWGVWTDELGAAFEKAMMSALRTIPKDERWSVLANISEFPPQKQSVQDAHARCMTFARERIVRAANLVSSSLNQMQIRRLSQEIGLPAYSFFTNEAEALRWLKEGTREQ
jgi:hypothetical protein